MNLLKLELHASSVPRLFSDWRSFTKRLIDSKTSQLSLLSLDILGINYCYAH